MLYTHMKTMPKGRGVSVELPALAVGWEALGAVEGLAADAALTEALVAVVDSEDVAADAVDSERAVAVVADELEAVASKGLKAAAAALGLW